MKIKTIITMILLLAGSLCMGDEILPKIEIISQAQEIRVGEPLILKLVYRFQQPIISPDTGKVRENFKHSAYLNIEHKDKKFSTRRVPLFPIDLKIKNGQGLEYDRWFVCFYHYGEGRLLFPVPGKYSVTANGWTKRSKPLHIEVKEPSELEKLALLLLSDMNDYFFLESGEYDDEQKRPERMSHLIEVVEQCKGTTLAKWAAACLGIEYFIEFHRKHPSFEKFKDKRQKDKVEEPFFDLACKYLAIGADLPDEFQIREKVLWRLIDAEFIKDNYEKMDILLDELEAKYPSGKYGRKAPRTRIELKRLKKQHSEQSKKDKDNNDVK